MRTYPITVLCIDDDSDDIVCFRDALEAVDSTCHCLAVSSAQAGFEVLKTQVPDVIFLDINMPRIDGHEALVSIRKITSLINVPVYMLSTSICNEELEGFKRDGATGGFTKPETFLGLCKILDDVLGSLKSHDGISGTRS
jgi:CheY-like chemotaxis protein